jgi:hypothetical protein
VIFKLAPPRKAGGAWTETLPYKLTGVDDGYNPTTGVLVDSAGDIYGTGQIVPGYGMVFSLVRTNFPELPWEFKSLVNQIRASNFTFGSNGIYGVGTHGATSTPTVFTIPLTSGGPPVLYTQFQDKGDGPPAGSLAVINDRIFGTTPTGGKSIGGVSLGTAFELGVPMSVLVRKKSIIFSFPGGTGGWDPVTGLIADASGNLYGATAHGGAGSGVIFKLKPPKTAGAAWTETVLHSFGNDGYPQGDLILAKGVLYGTTGGDAKHNTYGEVFSLTPPAAGQTGWRYTVLHTFTGGQDGALPRGGLVAGAQGVLYGTTANGGGRGTCSDGSVKGCGTVFEVIP